MTIKQIFADLKARGEWAITICPDGTIHSRQGEDTYHTWVVLENGDELIRIDNI